MERSFFLDVSVVIITLNEEARLKACLDSLPEGVEIIVLDSGSSDLTVDIARKKGARVETRAFTNYAEQKNAALGLATRSWILSLDADEVLSGELRDNIVRSVNEPHSQIQGFRIRRRLVFMGRKLRFGKSSDRPLRFFRRGKGQFRSAIHEQIDLGRELVSTLNGELLHYSYQDLTDYFRRFNLYTSRIAENHAAKGRTPQYLLFHVMRPWVEFFNRYVLRLGFLDGYPGYAYALVSSLYTFVKYAKLLELKKQGPQGSIDI